MSYIRLFFLIVPLLLIASAPTSAQMDDWAYLEPENGAFEARFPKTHTAVENKIRLDENSESYIATYSAKVRERGNDKTYLIKLEQKIGDKLTANMIAFALANDTAQYEKMAKTLKGELVTETDLTYKEFRGKDLFLTYKDKETKIKMGIRVRILFTDVSRLYMVVQGPADISYSYRSNNFFDNIRLLDGRPPLPGSFSESMKAYASPKNIFTIRAPKAGNPFIEKEPETTETPRTDSIRVAYIDPIIKYKTYYTVRSFITEKPLNNLQVRALLVEDFIKNYMSNASPTSIRVEEISINDRKIYTAQASIPTTPENPNINFLMLEAHQKDNIIAVQEMAGTAAQVLSPLSMSTFEAFQFHPLRFLDPTARRTAPLSRLAPSGRRLISICKSSALTSYDFRL
jgi:hypothetical protein